MSDILTEAQAEKATRILTRRFRKPPKKHRSRAGNLHPVVDFMFDELDHLEVTDVEMQSRTKMSRNILSNWRTGASPRLSAVEAALNAIGYTLVAVPLPETK